MRLRVARGAGAGPTALSAYDAALLDAGVGNYNLLRLSSVLPAGASLDRVDRIPDLGPVGGELRVVEASATAPPGETAAAALGWVRREDGSGLFYEEGAVASDRSVAAHESAVADRVREGLIAGLDRRGWTATDPTVVTAGATDDEAFASAVAVAAYGRAQPIGGRDVEVDAGVDDPS